MNEEFAVVMVAVGKPEEAQKIADAVVRERLAACCNLVSGVRSVYRWKGEMCRDEETLLVIKTRAENFPALRERIVAMHSYEVPEVIALPIMAGHAPYLDWLREETAR